MHDGVQYDSIQGQGHRPLKVGNSTICKGYLLSHLQWGWQMRAQYLKVIGAGFFIFVLGFVSRDFELGTVRLLRGVDRQFRMELSYCYY